MTQIIFQILYHNDTNLSPWVLEVQGVLEGPV